MQVTVAPLQFGDIPAITIVGTSPTFYIIHVTTNLLDALEHATYPAQAVIVGQYRPAVPNPQSYLTDGMRPLTNRTLIFQCFKAFKALFVSLSFLISLKQPISLFSKW